MKEKDYFYKTEFFKQLENQNDYFNSSLIHINKRIDRLYYIFIGFSLANIGILFFGVKIGFNLFNVKV